MSEGKKEIKKGKLIIVGIIVAVVLGIIIFNVINKDGGIGNKGNTGNEEGNAVYNLPDVTYSDMQVTNVEMEYLQYNTKSCTK